VDSVEAHPAASAARRRGKEQQDYLVFVDTNVLLDLYRSRGDSTVIALGKLLESRDKIISTFQVRNEFLRNRTTVISQSLRELRRSLERPSVPAMFADTTALRMYEQAVKELNQRKEQLCTRLSTALRHPTDRDEAYKLVSKFFGEEVGFFLEDGTDNSHVFYYKAARRHKLGNPPRKKESESIGDALNWEWCLDVCRSETKDLVVVTRDGDYGEKAEGDLVLPNLLLHEEFKSEVSRKRKLVITPSVNTALKLIGTKVSDDEVRKERAEIKEAMPARPGTESYKLELQRYLAEVFTEALSATSTTGKTIGGLLPGPVPQAPSAEEE
jgi:hypothetical protein